MADFSALIPFIKASEGGLSRDPVDNASSYPAPWSYTYKGVTASDWHTNKGVTYKTFESLSSKLGYANTPANFFTMPDDIWFKIFKNGYWDKMQGDLLKSGGIAYVLANMAWGSGAGSWTSNSGAKDYVKDFVKDKFNVVIDSDSKMISFINQVKDEAAFINQMIDYRLQRLSGHPDWWKYGKGWTNRYEALRDLALTLVSPIAGITSAIQKKNFWVIAGVVLVVIIGGILIYKYVIKKK